MSLFYFNHDIIVPRVSGDDPQWQACAPPTFCVPRSREDDPLVAVNGERGMIPVVYCLGDTNRIPEV